METHFSKISIRKSQQNAEFDTEDNILLYLRKIQENEDLPVFESLNILLQGKINTVSFSKDNPYRYFYARLDRDSISVKLRKLREEIEFKVKPKTLRKSYLLIV